MKRAKLPAMKHNAAVVLGNVGTAEDADVLTRALDDAEPLVRERAVWALERLRQRSVSVSEPLVRDHAAWALGNAEARPGRRSFW